MKLQPLYLIFISLFLLNSLKADISVAPIFSDNMVLQREAVIPLRGTATGEQEVVLHFNGKAYVSSVEDQRYRLHGAQPTVHCALCTQARLGAQFAAGA